MIKRGRKQEGLTKRHRETQRHEEKGKKAIRINRETQRHEERMEMRKRETDGQTDRRTEKEIH